MTCWCISYIKWVGIKILNLVHFPCKDSFGPLPRLSFTQEKRFKPMHSLYMMYCVVALPLPWCFNSSSIFCRVNVTFDLYGFFPFYVHACCESGCHLTTCEACDLIFIKVLQLLWKSSFQNPIYGQSSQPPSLEDNEEPPHKVARKPHLSMWVLPNLF